MRVAQKNISVNTNWRNCVMKEKIKIGYIYLTSFISISLIFILCQNQENGYFEVYVIMIYLYGILMFLLYNIDLP